MKAWRDNCDKKRCEGGNALVVGIQNALGCSTIPGLTHIREGRFSVFGGCAVTGADLF